MVALLELNKNKQKEVEANLEAAIENIANKVQELANIKVQNQQKDLLINQLNQTITSNKNQIDGFSANISNLNDQISTLNNDITTKENEIQSLNQKYLNLEKQYLSTTDSQAIIKLKEQLTTYKNSLNFITNQKSQIQQQLDDLVNQKTQLENQKNAVEVKNQELLANINTLTNEKNSLNNTILNKENDLIQLRQTIAQLDSAKKQNDTLISTLQDSVSTYQSTIATLNQQINDKTQEISSLESKVENLKLLAATHGSSNLSDDIDQALTDLTFDVYDKASKTVLDVSENMVREISGLNPKFRISNLMINDRDIDTNSINITVEIVDTTNNAKKSIAKTITGFKALITEVETPSEPEVEKHVASISELRNINFNNDWKFTRSSVTNGITGVNYDDSSMMNLNLPHDWSIYLDYSPTISNEWGALEGGVGYYRKTFDVEPEWKDKEISIHFEGVYMESEIWVNGTKIGNYPSGYQSFTYDISKYLKFDGSKNVIVVKAQNKSDSSRWYSGSGIYRDVNLIVKNKINVAEYGVVITHNNLQANKDATVTSNVKYSLENNTNENATIKIKQTIYKKGSDQVVATNTSNDITLNAGTTTDHSLTFDVNQPALWDVDNPNIYLLKTEILNQNDQVIDETTTRFGYKWTNWTVDDGFSLNGKWMKLHGVSMHHDQGALGAVANYDAMYRQLKKMKDMGVNAIRSTHNPADIKYVEICEDLGLLLIDEAFDTWYAGKKSQDYHRFFEQPSTHPKANNVTWAEYDLKQMIRQKINSVAIFMWSIGNEIGESTSTKGVTVGKQLAAWAKGVDTTRYITWGNDKYRFGNGENANVSAISDALDVVGMNYSEANATNLKTAHPSWKIYGSETSSAVRSRGVWYAPGSYDNGTSTVSEYGKELSDYGNNRVGWGRTATSSWKFDRDNKWYAGQFIWTGWDYIGEPTPWHSHRGNDAPKSSYFGIVDTAGFEKNDYYLYQSQWLDVKKHPMVKIAPHWTWDQTNYRNLVTQNGQIALRVYSNARTIKLYKNDQLISEKTFNVRTTNYGLEYQEGENDNELYLKWMLDYEPATIKAEAYDAEGNLVATDIIKTANPPIAIKVVPEKSVILANGDSLAYFAISAVDEEGTEYPWAKNLINFEVDGQGEIVGVDNGDAWSRERMKAYPGNVWKRSLFNGKAIVIVKSNKNQGVITLKAKSENLIDGSASVYAIKDVEPNNNQVIHLLTNNVLIKQSETLMLPKTVKAITKAGTIIQKQVVWDTSNVQTTIPGKYYATTEVDGTVFKIQVDVINFVSTYKPIDYFDVVGVGYDLNTYLPTKIDLDSKYGHLTEDVTWDIADHSTDQVGLLEINGHLTKYPQVATKAYIKVKALTRTIDPNKQYISPSTAEANASFKQGGDLPKYVIDGAVDASKRWTNWVSGNKGNARETTFDITLNQAQDIKALGIHLFGDGNTHTNGPESIIIQYSNDGTTYMDVSNQSNTNNFPDAKNVSKEHLMSFDAINTKYLRLKITARAKNSDFWVVGLVEVKAYGESDLLIKDTSNQLASIVINNQPISSFDANLTDYSTTISYSQAFPVVQFNLPENSSAHVSVVEFDLDNLTKAYKATVIAENQTKKVYTLKVVKELDKVTSFNITVPNLAVGLKGKIELDARLEDGSKLDPSKMENLTFVDANPLVNSLYTIDNNYLLAQGAGSSSLYATFEYKGQSYRSNISNINIINAIRSNEIQSFTSPNYETFVNETINIDSFLLARYKNEQFDRKLAITWEQAIPSRFSNAGLYTYKGIINSLNQEIYLTIVVKDYVSVDAIAATTAIGLEPYNVPTQVTVYDSDGTSYVKDVVWDEFTTEELTTEGSKVHYGTINGTNLKAILNLRVATSTQNQDITRQVTGFDYPAAIASFTNDKDAASTDRINKVNDGIVQKDNNKWSNWQRSKRASDWVGLVFARGGVLTKEHIDSVSIFFGGDSGTSSPKTYTIEYFDEPITLLPSLENLGYIDQSESNLKDNSKWHEVTYINKPESLTDDGTINTIKFNPVKAYAIRIKMTPKDNKNGMIITEMRVDRPIVNANTDYTISQVSVNDTPLAEFDTNTYDYTINLNGTTTPKVDFTVTNNAIVKQNLVDDTLVVKVAAENSQAIKTYNFKLIPTTPVIENYKELRAHLIEQLDKVVFSNGVAKYTQAQMLKVQAKESLKDILSLNKTKVDGLITQIKTLMGESYIEFNHTAS
ncbi:DUF4982 domain-containing protein [Mycoplasma sp. NEAQ87857]|uniref:glycoside hydrolase family 2 TIM barrel-domain containing protein n=1 Tax=Mycoplasma sp. NEAQ87857 TaxID=2683967 RepID=UPI001316F5F2|nr:glycoside hydrolase family 2 TIM barrel-domain containing protein [Mycoplasma sp. NEAQ87857]QGZ97577.1 DUF4982 domain-containing protein [Mycoplasma sp. NEAQ87857]